MSMDKEKKSLSFRSAPIILALLVLSCDSGLLRADGMRNPPTGPEAISMIGGKVAAVDDLTAITHNPANLTEITMPSAEACLTFGYSETRFRSLGGDVAKSREPWAVLPAIYAAVPLKETPCVLGIGFDVPFGRSATWSKKTTTDMALFGYTAPYFTQLQTLNINPTFACKLSKDVSVGVGLDILRGDIDYRQIFPWSMMISGAPDGDMRLTGSGYGYGWNAGVSWDITDRQRVSLTFRSPIVVDFDGSTTINNIIPVGPYAGVTPRSSLNTKIPFPAVAAAGYRIGLTDTVHVEMDVEWIGSSTFRQLTVDAANNSILFQGIAPGNPPALPQDWRDAYTIGMGADWRFAPNWTLRGGWMYLAGPVPDATFAPNMVDDDQMVLSTGVQYKQGRHTLNLAYAAGIFFGSRTIANDVNTAFNGKYTFQSHLGSISYVYAF